VRSMGRRLALVLAALGFVSEAACTRTDILPAPSTPAFDRTHAKAGAAVPRGLYHVMTGDYLTQESDLSNLSKYAPYLTYAYAPTNYLATLRKMGVRTLFYTNPLQPICTTFKASTCIRGDKVAFNYLRSEYKAAASRNCRGRLIHGSYRDYPVLQLNVNASSATAYLQAVMDHLRAYVAAENGGDVNAASLYFVDNAVANVYGTTSTECNQEPQQWEAQIATDFRGITGGPFAINGLGASSVAGVQQRLEAIRSPNVTMVLEENCYGGHGWNSEQPGNFVADTTGHYTWLASEYGEIRSIAMHKTFWCLNRLLGMGYRYPAWRLYTYASFLLSYEPHHAVYELDLATSSHLKVFPEMLFVPEEPAYTANEVSGYLQSSGVYLRRFRYCYYRGAYKGPCAVAVNPSPNATLQTPRGYTRHVELKGGGVLDGGTLTLVKRVPHSMSPITAQILLP